MRNKNRTKIYLVAFAIVFQATASFTIAAFVVTPNVVAGVTAFADFRPKRVGISFQTRFYRSLSFLLVAQVVGTVVAVAHVTELAVREAVTVSESKHNGERYGREKRIFIDFPRTRFFSGRRQDLRSLFFRENMEKFQILIHSQ